MLEKRSIDDVHTVTMSIQLEQKVSNFSSLKHLTLSDDGTMCAIGAGSSRFFILVDLTNRSQHKLSSTNRCNVPCFINGETEYVVTGGGNREGVEVWDIQSKKVIQKLQIQSGSIYCSTSVRSILAVASSGGDLKLWDVRNRETIHSVKFDGLSARSLYLTADTKYLTFAGNKWDMCVVLEIK